MKRLTVITVLWLCMGFVSLSAGNDALKEVVAPTGLLVTGIGIASLWTMDLISQKNVEMNGNIFKARDKGTDQLLWPHLLAEYGTAALSITSAVGLYRDQSWARPLTLVSCGMMTYTSVNSMSWVLSKKERYAYAMPMMLGLACAGVAVVAVF